MQRTCSRHRNIATTDLTGSVYSHQHSFLKCVPWRAPEHLVLRVKLGFALGFLYIYRNTKPLQLPPGPMLSGFHSLPSKPEETSLSVETMSLWSQSVNKNLCDKKHGNWAAFHLPVRLNRNTLFWIAWLDFHPPPAMESNRSPYWCGTEYKKNFTPSFGHSEQQTSQDP